MKKAMKRALLLALAVAMLVCMSACGKCAWKIKINGKGIFSVALMQDGSIIGTVKVEADNVDDIDRKSKIRQISAAQSSSDKKGMSIAGVKCGDDKAEVKKVFGEPDSPDADAWKYKKRGFLATFFFDDDGKVTMLSISDIDDEDT